MVDGNLPNKTGPFCFRMRCDFSSELWMRSQFVSIRDSRFYRATVTSIHFSSEVQATTREVMMFHPNLQLAIDSHSQLIIRKSKSRLLWYLHSTVSPIYKLCSQAVRPSPSIILLRATHTNDTHPSKAPINIVFIITRSTLPSSKIQHTKVQLRQPQHLSVFLLLHPRQLTTRYKNLGI